MKSREGGDLAERASIRELEPQDLEKLTVFSTDSFTTTSLHAPSPEDMESRPNPITLKTWIELTDRIKNKIKICCNLRKCQLCRLFFSYIINIPGISPPSRDKSLEGRISLLINFLFFRACSKKRVYPVYLVYPV